MEMEINEFRERLLDDINYSATINNFSTRESFLNEISSILIDADLIDEEILYTYYDGTGYRNKSVAIDGYLYNELDENLCLYIIYLNDSHDSIETITQTTAYNQLKKAYSFITDSGYIVDNYEESSSVYDLACDIFRKNYSIRKFSIYLVTDYAMSRSIKSIDNELFNNIGHIFQILNAFLLIYKLPVIK